MGKLFWELLPVLMLDYARPGRLSVMYWRTLRHSRYQPKLVLQQWQAENAAHENYQNARRSLFEAAQWDEKA